MSFPSSAIFIVVVLGFASYLIYMQNQSIEQQQIQIPNQIMKYLQQKQPSPLPNEQQQQMYQQPMQMPPMTTQITIQNDEDRFSDSIKRQDAHMMYDPLTYPQLRLPREVLDRYNEFYEKTGTYPPFNQATQPQLFDNPILNGVLVKINEDAEPFNNNVPSAVPLFRVKSVKNDNRYFYYIVDQRYLSKIEMKIPLDHIKVNGTTYNQSDFYGIPELFDGDIITNIPIYPIAKFKVTLYKTYHFP